MSIEDKLKKKLGESFILLLLGNISFHGGDGSQAYLIFQPMYRHFKFNANTKYISSWKSKGLSDESSKPPTTSDNSLTPLINYHGYRIMLEFNGSCLKQPRVTYTNEKAVFIYIVYELVGYSSYTDDPTLKYCLFGAVALTKNADIDKYGYSGYGIGFDRKSSFSFPGGGFRQDVVIFGVDMSPSAHVNNKKRHVSAWKRASWGARTYIHCRKNVFN